MDKIQQLENKILKMQEIIISIILVQDRVTQYRLRKAYPELDSIIQTIEERNK